MAKANKTKKKKVKLKLAEDKLLKLNMSFDSAITHLMKPNNKQPKP